MFICGFPPNLIDRKHQSWITRRFSWLLFVYSSFLAFVIDLLGSPLKRDFPFTPTGWSGSGITVIGYEVPCQLSMKAVTSWRVENDIEVRISDDIPVPSFFQKMFPGEDGNVMLRFSFISITADGGRILNISFLLQSLP